MITNCLKEAARLVDVKIEIECKKKLIFLDSNME